MAVAAALLRRRALYSALTSPSWLHGLCSLSLMWHVGVFPFSCLLEVCLVRHVYGEMAK